MPGTLSQHQVERYRRDGYLSPLPALDDAFRAREGRAADVVLRSKPHLVFPWLYDLLRDPAVVGPVQSILGPDLLVWGTSFFAKEAGDPAHVTWHQDSTYWGLEPMDILTAWIAFTPSRRENGCMRVLPGSHAAGQLHHRDTFAADNLLSRGQEIAVDVDAAEAADLVLQPGEMSLHHVGIVHGSEPNGSTIPRIGFTVRYIAAHVRQAGARTTATLAAGVDRYGHFEHEPRPAGDYDAAGRAYREDALARVKTVLFAGAAGADARVRDYGRAG